MFPLLLLLAAHSHRRQWWNFLPLFLSLSVLQPLSSPPPRFCSHNSRFSFSLTLGSIHFPLTAFISLYYPAFPGWCYPPLALFSIIPCFILFYFYYFFYRWITPSSRNMWAIALWARLKRREGMIKGGRYCGTLAGLNSTTLIQFQGLCNWIKWSSLTHKTELEM